MDGPLSKAVYEVKYDLQAGWILSYEQIINESGSAYETLRVTKSYDFDRLRHIPATIVTENKGVNGRWQTTKWTVENIDWNPVPEEVFLIESRATPQPTVWIRRLLLLIVGVGLLGIYLANRRRRSRA